MDKGRQSQSRCRSGAPQHLLGFEVAYGDVEQWLRIIDFMGDELSTATQASDQAAPFSAVSSDLRAITGTDRGRAAAINSEMVATYWKIGERIVREEQHGTLWAAYGERALERLG